MELSITSATAYCLSTHCINIKCTFESAMNINITKWWCLELAVWNPVIILSVISVPNEYIMFWQWNEGKLALKASKCDCDSCFDSRPCSYGFPYRPFSCSRMQWTHIYLDNSWQNDTQNVHVLAVIYCLSKVACFQSATRGLLSKLDFVMRRAWLTNCF